MVLIMLGTHAFTVRRWELITNIIDANGMPLDMYSTTNHRHRIYIKALHALMVVFTSNIPDMLHCLCVLWAWHLWESWCGSNTEITCKSKMILWRTCRGRGGGGGGGGGGGRRRRTSRIIIINFNHETNTFIVNHTLLSHFMLFRLLHVSRGSATEVDPLAARFLQVLPHAILRCVMDLIVARLQICLILCHADACSRP